MPKTLAIAGRGIVGHERLTLRLCEAAASIETTPSEDDRRPHDRLSR
jgi:hypothetical protein